MGLERKTIATRDGIQSEGKLYVDSKCITFRSKDWKWSADLHRKLSATVKASKLCVSQDATSISFDVGDEGKKWLNKVLNPPSRSQKLGVKPGMACWLSTGFENVFRKEVRDSGAKVVRSPSRCNLAFLWLECRESMGALLETVEQLPVGTSIWVVYPKGSDAITQGDVMSQAKKLGMGPSKTAAFDDQRSSMRYAKK